MKQKNNEIKKALERDQKRGDVRTAFMLSTGWSKRIDRLDNKNYDNETLEYARAQQSGWNFGLDIRFPVSPRNAFGLKYSGFFSPHADDFVISTSPPATINIKSDVWIHYLAPTFNVTIPNLKSTRALMLGFGFGYLRYTETTGVEPPIMASGNNFGFNLDLGYDFALQKVLSPFVRFSFCIGNIISARVEQGSNIVSGKLRVPENLSRFDVSVGLRLNQKKKE